MSVKRISGPGPRPGSTLDLPDFREVPSPLLDCTEVLPPKGQHDPPTQHPPHRHASAWRLDRNAPANRNLRWVLRGYEALANSVLQLDDPYAQPEIPIDLMHFTQAADEYSYGAVPHANLYGADAAPRHDHVRLNLSKGGALGAALAAVCAASSEHVSRLLRPSRHPHLYNGVLYIDSVEQPGHFKPVQLLVDDRVPVRIDGVPLGHNTMPTEPMPVWHLLLAKMIAKLDNVLVHSSHARAPISLDTGASFALVPPGLAQAAGSDRGVAGPRRRAILASATALDVPARTAAGDQTDGCSRLDTDMVMPRKLASIVAFLQTLTGKPASECIVETGNVATLQEALQAMSHAEVSTAAAVTFRDVWALHPLKCAMGAVATVFGGLGLHVHGSDTDVILLSDHYYAITAVDPTRQAVQLYNPLGWNPDPVLTQDAQAEQFIAPEQLDAMPKAPATFWISTAWLPRLGLRLARCEVARIG